MPDTVCYFFASQNKVRMACECLRFGICYLLVFNIFIVLVHRGRLLGRRFAIYFVLLFVWIIIVYTFQNERGKCFVGNRWRHNGI